MRRGCETFDWPKTPVLLSARRIAFSSLPERAGMAMVPPPYCSSEGKEGPSCPEGADKSLTMTRAVSPPPSLSLVPNDRFNEQSGSPRKQSFNNFKFDETISAVFIGRRASPLKRAVYLISVVATAGFTYLLTRWLPRLKSQVLTASSPLLEATHVLVINSFSQAELVETKRQKVHLNSNTFQSLVNLDDKDGETTVLTMDYRCNRFILDPVTGLFIPVNKLLPACLPTAEHNMTGLTSAKHAEIKYFIGKNVIEIEEKSVLQIFYNEILHPFYIFQVASFFIWISEDYELYAIVILIIATASAVLTVIETKRNLDKMRTMSRFICQIKVHRDGKIIECSSEDLVPGDMLVLDEDVGLIPCDGVLVNGDAILDESMLTGETVPVTKFDILDDQYSAMIKEDGIEDPRHCLYSGTRLLRCRPRHGKPALLVVTRTGFLTTKGSLVQSILFPRPNNFRFYRDSMLFIGILGVIAALGFSIAIVNFVMLGVGVYWIIVRALDVITVVVPPALPATMAVGTVFALQRLEKNQIFCISPPRINVASKVEVLCFDKTGTLTEEGLEIFGILPVSEDYADKGMMEPTFCILANTLQKLTSLGSNSIQLLRLMATCHSLRRINGRLLGDSLDLRMFEFTQWELEELQDVGEAIVPTIVHPPGSTPFNVSEMIRLKTTKTGSSPLPSSEIGIIRQFDFSSKLRRMSVVAKSLSNDCLYVYAKGSPESLLDICRPETIPDDYSKLLAQYAHNGYRVIGCASKICHGLSWLKAQKMSREQAESGLTFLGFIVFENRLKPQTEPTISMLKSAGITNIMATGDNILTAISVGRASGIITESALVFYPESFLRASTSRDVLWQCVDDVNLPFDPVRLRPAGGMSDKDFALAVSGDFFEWMHDCLPCEYRQRILKRCLIYARMSPQQKQLLVEVIQQRPVVVGFCGDGANDCGALKAADVGISISQAEASIAAPFTSKVQDISCVPMLLREGRASLVTSFCCFKYMTLYSMIQFTTLIFLYSYGSTLSDGQFVYVDLVLIVPLGILMSRYEPSKRLAPQQPTAKLVSPVILTTILGHIVIQALAQVIVYYTLAAPAAIGWVPPNPEDESNTFHPSTSVMFLFSAFLYIGTALIFSAGQPFRERVYWPFIIYALLGLLGTLSIIIFHLRWLHNWLYLTVIPTKTRILIVISATLYFVSAMIFDRLIAPRLAYIIDYTISPRPVNDGDPKDLVQ